MTRIVLYLAASYGLIGAVCVGLTHSAMAFLYPAAGLAMVAAMVLVFGLAVAGLLFIVIGIGKAGMDINHRASHRTRLM
jgi:hypothetical protein